MAEHNLRSRNVSKSTLDGIPDMADQREINETSTRPLITEKDDASKPDDSADDNTLQSTVMLAIIFTGAVISMWIIYRNFPPVQEEDAAKIKLPKSMSDAQDLGRVLSKYKDDYFVEVVLAFIVTYVFLQSFAIPGSIFLSILSGFLFPFAMALFLVCLCSSVGASLCYLLSSLVGKGLVRKYFPERIAKWKKEIAKHRNDFLSYIIFLRITPFLPNWFINVTAPVLNVSLWPFFLGTFIGVAPPSFGFISAGVELYELTTYGDAFSFRSILLVVVSAILSLLPVVARRFFGTMETKT